MQRRWIGAIGFGCALLAGCAAEQRPTVSSEQAMQYLSVGQPLLRCREPCLADWRTAQPKAQSLAAIARWRELAVLLAGVGYQDDLSLYYLGQAAQGLGYAAAAAIYYRQSIELSGTSISCANLSKQCGGVSLPQAAQARLAELNRPARPVRRAPSAAPNTGATPAPEAPAETPPAEAAPVSIPPATATEAPAVAAPPPERPLPPPPPVVAPVLPRETPVPRAGEDYIEPPPARR